MDSQNLGCTLMGVHSVVEVKNRLPSLIDKAIEGEYVVITRGTAGRSRSCGRRESMIHRWQRPPRMLGYGRGAMRGRRYPVTSVELLRQPE